MTSDHAALRALLALAKLEEWLRAHPLGHAQFLSDPNGRICHLLDFDAAKAEEFASRTGFGPDAVSAMLAALSEEPTV